MSLEFAYLGTVLVLFLITVFSGRLSIDVAALLMMLSLVLPWRLDEGGELHGILTISQGLSGFGSTAVVMVVSMFVLSAAMERTGAAALIGGRLLERASGSETGLLLAVLVAVTLFSAVVSDTTSVLVWMPLLLVWARRRKYAPSRLLMPLAYAALLGGQWTLIGTRTNIVLSDFLRTQTGDGLGFLAFTPIAVVNWACVVGYMVFFGRRGLPRRAESSSLADRYEVTEYLTEVMLSPGTEAVGRSLRELELGAEDITILGVIRGDEHLPPRPYLTLAPNDVLIVQGPISHISTLMARPGVEVREELQVQDQTLRSVDLRMVEALIATGSRLEGRSLAQLDFPKRYGLSVLAIGRGGRSLTGRPLDERLRAGDSLLIVGHEEVIHSLRTDPDLYLLESRAAPVTSKRKARLLIATIPVVVLLAASRLLDPALCVVLGAMVAVLGGCISMRAAYEAIDWRVVFVLGGMLPFGLALEETGSASALATGVVGTFGDLGPHTVFAILLLLVVLLTQVVENTAVAVVIAPVAFQLALATGSDPVPFLLGTALCASAGFASPLAHECTLLVMGPGGYRFRDYLRLGIPAAAITYAVTCVLVPLVYPF